MIAASMEKSSSHRFGPCLGEPAEEMQINVPQVGYEAVKEGAKSSLFRLVQILIVEAFIHGKMDSLFMKNKDQLTQSERWLDKLMWRETRGQSPISPMPEHVKRQMDKIEEEHSLVERLQEKFLKSTLQSPWKTLKVDADVVTPPTPIPSKADLDKQRLHRGQHGTECHKKRCLGNRSTLPEDDTLGKRNNKSRKAPVSEDSVARSWETEAAKDYYSGESPKEFWKSEKPKRLRLVKDRVISALDYNAYHLVERSSLCEDQVMRHMAQWKSRVQVEMKA